MIHTVSQNTTFINKKYEGHYKNLFSIYNDRNVVKTRDPNTKHMSN